MQKLFSPDLFRKVMPATVLVILLFSQTIFAGSSPPRVSFLDFSGIDRRSDFVVVRNNGGLLVWDILRNQDSGPDVRTTFTYGGFSDQIVPGNYFIDSGKYEASFYRRSQATYFTGYFADYMTSVPYPMLTAWGQANDDARFYGDYDGDGRDDPTVLRYQASTGLFYWYIRGSAGTNYTMLFGSNNPETYEFAFRGADWNGDGKDEIVFTYVYIATGEVVWYFGSPINQSLVAVKSFGNYGSSYLLNPADYTGDGRADLVTWTGKGFSYPAIYGNWNLYDTGAGVGTTLLWQGYIGVDRPVGGDYDGDGITDFAFYASSTATYTWFKSTNRNLSSSAPYKYFGIPGGSRTFGSPGDTAVAGLWTY